MLGTVLLIVLILLLIGALPTWPHSAGWGYYPSGGLGLVLIIVLILLLLGRISESARGISQDWALDLTNLNQPMFALGH